MGAIKPRPGRSVVALQMLTDLEAAWGVRSDEARAGGQEIRREVSECRNGAFVSL